MKRLTITTWLFSFAVAAYSQNIKLEAISDHYGTLSQISSTPNPARLWMDTVSYPSSAYGSSIVYLLVKPHYLTEADIKALSESVKFPANSSDQTRSELDYLLDLQNKRTAEQVKRVEFLGNIGYWPSVNMVPSHPGYEQNLKDLFFEGREILGGDMTAGNFPKISKLLQGIMQDMRIMEFTIKYQQLRPRPYHLESALQPLAKMSSPSYASGHTLWAFLQAFMWSELVPEQQTRFIALAEEIRRSREIMGIHYPSDNEAARQVAYRMFQACFRNESFVKDFKEAEGEWRSYSERKVRNPGN